MLSIMISLAVVIGNFLRLGYEFEYWCSPGYSLGLKCSFICRMPLISLIYVSQIKISGKGVLNNK